MNMDLIRRKNELWEALSTAELPPELFDELESLYLALREESGLEIDEEDEV